MVKKKGFFMKNNIICGKLRKMANFAAANLPLRPQKTTMTDCMLQNGMGKWRQLHYLQFLRSGRQMDWARNNRQLTDLTILIKSLVKRSTINGKTLKCDILWRPS